MICPRPDCPIERTARALESSRTVPFSAQTETCEHCALCNGKLVCWERVVHKQKDGSTRVELRLKSKHDAGESIAH